MISICRCFGIPSARPKQDVGDRCTPIVSKNANKKGRANKSDYWSCAFDADVLTMLCPSDAAPQKLVD